jgi:thiol-disulfide isomerase/thioredoxin
MTVNPLPLIVQNNPPVAQTTQSIVHTEPPTSNPRPATHTSPNANYTLFNFYSPDCPYSRQFNVTWDQLLNKLGSVSDLNMRAVNASDPENENLAFYYGVEGFPTIMFVGPTKKEKYEGSRDIDSVTQYVLAKMRAQ